MLRDVLTRLSEPSRLVADAHRLRRRPRLLAASKVIALLRLAARFAPRGDDDRVERVTAAVFSRLGIDLPTGDAGRCSRCARDARMLLADIASVGDKRCVRCAPSSWIDLYLGSVERFLEESASAVN